MPVSAVEAALTRVRQAASAASPGWCLFWYGAEPALAGPETTIAAAAIANAKLRCMAASPCMFEFNECRKAAKQRHRTAILPDHTTVPTGR
jgi:hypothetical protein